MKTIYTYKLAAIAALFSFVSCSQDTDTLPAQLPIEATIDVNNDYPAGVVPVPFFELAKGDTVSKSIYREKPDFPDDVQVLFSSENDQHSLAKAFGSSAGGLGYMIYGLKTSVRSGNNAPATMEGYTKIPVDLNEGAGGKYIYLYYIKTGLNFAGAATVGNALYALDVKISSTPLLSPPSGYNALGTSFDNGGWTDLNQGAGGKYVKLQGEKVFHRYPYLSSGAQYPVITDIAIISSTSSMSSYSGWQLIPKDLNSGAGGRYIYLCFRTGMVTVSNY